MIELILLKCLLRLHYYFRKRLEVIPNAKMHTMPQKKFEMKTSTKEKRKCERNYFSIRKKFSKTNSRQNRKVMRCYD